MCRPSDSPAIRLFSGEEKVCSKQDSFRVVPGVLVFLEAGTIADAKSPPDRRARIIKPTAGLVFPDRFFSRLGFSRNGPPRHRQRLSYDQRPRRVGSVFDNVLINVIALGAFEGAQVEVGLRWFDSGKMHRRATLCAG
jgi:hypothetical protein